MDAQPPYSAGIISDLTDHRLQQAVNRWSTRCLSIGQPFCFMLFACWVIGIQTRHSCCYTARHNLSKSLALCTRVYPCVVTRASTHGNKGGNAMSSCATFNFTWLMFIGVCSVCNWSLYIWSVEVQLYICNIFRICLVQCPLVSNARTRMWTTPKQTTWLHNRSKPDTLPPCFMLVAADAFSQRWNRARCGKALWCCLPNFGSSCAVLCIYNSHMQTTWCKSSIHVYMAIQNGHILHLNASGKGAVVTMIHTYCAVFK
jgi:hypothetical protein